MELDSGHASMSTTQLPSEAVMDTAERTELQNNISSGNIVGTINGYTRMSPTDDDKDREGEEEKDEKESGSKKDSEEPKLSRREFIKRVLLTTLMLIAALLVNACFSVIAPFYPKEVVQ